MGTTWKISIWDDIENDALKNLEKEIFEMSDHFDKTYSRFIKTSLVWKIAEKAGIYEVPADFMSMLKPYFNLYEPSEKKLNPLIGFTISDLGYDEVYSLVPKEEIRSTPDLRETVKIIDDTHIETTEPVLFDFGALGKGYFVDRIAEVLKASGIVRFLVDGSGDIYYHDGREEDKKESIVAGLEHPEDATKVIGTLDIKGGAFCASGINRRKWYKYHHVIDPHANASIGEGIVATWVSTDNTALADALASCLFFVAPENLSAYRFEYVILNSIGQVKVSPGWKGELFV
jgi:thiamine biosynthesis lipoprotein